MLVALSLLGLLAAAPAAAPTSDATEWGALHFERSSSLTWPGLQAPPFSLLGERRMVHRFTLGFAPPESRVFELSVVSIERPMQPQSLARALFDPSANGSMWIGASVALPGPSNVRLSLGRTQALAASVLSVVSAASGGRAPVNLPRLLVSGRM